MDIETFKKIFLNYNDTIIRIIFTKNNINLSEGYSELQIFDEDIINKVFKNFYNMENIENITPLTLHFNRKIYYSQIKDAQNVYTEDYNLISNFKTKKYNIIIAYYEYIKQDTNSFPNLNKYHYTEDIVQKIYKFDKFDKLNNMIIILENNKIIIEFNNYNSDMLNKVYNLIKHISEI